MKKLTFLILSFTIKCLTIDSLKIPEKKTKLSSVNITKAEYYFYKPENEEAWIQKEWCMKSIIDKPVEIFFNSDKETHKLRLDNFFLFYGHKLDTVRVSKKGFIHMDHLLSSNNQSLFYISPLTSKFYLTTKHLPASAVHYYKNGTTLIVWWENLRHELGSKYVTFTFQTIFQARGDITFNYLTQMTGVHLRLLQKSTTKIGLSDAPYTTGDSQAPAKSYHTLYIEPSVVASNKRIILTPVPSCIAQQACGSCTALTQLTSLSCLWCPSLHVCSDGSDKLSIHWNKNNCPRDAFNETVKCAEHIDHEQQLLLEQQVKKYQLQQELQQQQQLQHINQSNSNHIQTLLDQGDTNFDTKFSDYNSDYLGYHSQPFKQASSYRLNFSTSSHHDSTRSNNITLELEQNETLKLHLYSILARVGFLFFKCLIFYCIFFLILFNVSLLWTCVVFHLPNSRLSSFLKKRFIFLTNFFKKRGMIDFRSLSESSVNEAIQLRTLRSIHHAQQSLRDPPLQHSQQPLQQQQSPSQLSQSPLKKKRLQHSHLKRPQQASPKQHSLLQQISLHREKRQFQDQPPLHLYKDKQQPPAQTPLQPLTQLLLLLSSQEQPSQCSVKEISPTQHFSPPPHQPQPLPLQRPPPPPPQQQKPPLQQPRQQLSPQQQPPLPWPPHPSQF